MSVDQSVESALNALSDGYRILAWRLNQILSKRRPELRIEALPPPAGTTLRGAAQRLSNSLLAIRPLYPEMPPDRSLNPWSLGHVNGLENRPTYVSLSINEEDIDFTLKFLDSDPQYDAWEIERWRQCIVQPVEKYQQEWKFFLSQFGSTKARDRTFLSVDLRELTGLSPTALRTYIGLAGVKKAGRGKKDHTYTVAEVRQVLEAILRKATDNKVKLRCQKSLIEL